MKTRNLILPVLIAILAFNFSCSKDDESEIREFETIGFDSEVVMEKLPEGLKSSDDEHAQMAVDYVESAIDWGDFSDHLTPPEDAVKAGKKSSETYTWTWNYGGAYVLTMWWTYHDDAQKNYWDIDIQYNGTDRYNYLSAWESKDQRSGQIMYNYQWVCAMDDASTDCEDVFWSYDWNVDNNDNYIFNFVVEAEEDGAANSMKYETKVNNDGSGSVKYYIYGDLFYDLNWDSAGNGSWIYYPGENQMSGSWTVN